MWDEDVVLYGYTLDQAVEDGVKSYIFENRWAQLSGGHPITATRAIMEAFSMAALIEIWNELVVWLKTVAPHLPEEDQMFVTKMNGQDVWILEDGSCFTILFPSDY